MAGKRKQSLWGGAITTEIPEGLLDASDFRQVPDTQEVFVPGAEADDTSLTGVRVNDSIIFDLIERAEHWLSTHRITNPIYKWNTVDWMEIPADFGRK